MFYMEHANEKIICPDIDGFYSPSVTPTVKWYFVRRTFVLSGQWGKCSVVSEKAMVGMRIMELHFSVSPLMKLLRQLY